LGEKSDTFLSLSIAVLTVSDSRTLETDDSGALLAGAREEIGAAGASRLVTQSAKMVLIATPLR